MKFKKIKKDDVVRVLAGKDLGKSGKIIKIDRDKGRVLVEGVSIVKKTYKKSNKNPNGAIVETESFIDISNVMIICPSCKKATRISISILKDEKKRVCKKCKAVIDKND